MYRICLMGLLLLTTLFSVDTTSVEAQAGAEVCPPLVEQALVELADNCDNLLMNNACYGFNQVDSTFAMEVEPGFFSDPSDRTELTPLRNISTSPLNPDEEQWGIAVMNVQANVPGTAPGQAVTFLMLGDSQVENRVDPESVPAQVDPVAVRLQTSSTARTSPTTTANTVGTLLAGTVLETDALSMQTDWLRVFVDGRTAWILRDTVIPVGDLDALPIVTQTTRTPMQAFYFTTGFGDPVCSEAPNAVTISSPDTMTVDLTVNGVDIRIGSTVSFKNISENEIVMMVHEGTLETVDGQLIRAGEAIQADLNPDGTILGWQAIRPMTAAEIALGEISLRALNAIAPPRQVATITPANVPPGSASHIIQTGETLFSIAREYGADMQEIMDANSLFDPNTIPEGQLIVIPNPGVGFNTLPAVTVNTPVIPTIPNTTPIESAGGLIDCSGFGPTSPTSGLNYGISQFYWDAPAGAVDGYRVTVTNLDEGRVLTGSVAAPTTTLSLELTQGSIGGGFDFVWEVQALSDGQAVCSSPRVVTQRAAADPVVAAPVAFSASWGCGGTGQVQVNWNNAPAGDTITFNSNAIQGGPPPIIINDPGLSGPSGSKTYSADSVSNGVVTTSSGVSIVLTPTTIDLTACP